jgi:hypothetical protein
MLVNRASTMVSSWPAVEVRGGDLGDDAEDADHLITPEERLRVAMARQ